MSRTRSRSLIRPRSLSGGPLAVAPKGHRRGVWVAALLLLTGLAASPGVAQSQSPSQSPSRLPSRDTTLRVAANAVVDVTIRSGRLVVRGVDGVSGAVRAATNDYQLRSTGLTLTVSARDDDRRGDGRAVELDLPRGVRLIVSTMSGDVEVADIGGGVEVRSTSGDVQLTRIGGRVIVETIAGDVVVTGGDDVRVRTVSGRLAVREVRGAVALYTTSGDARVRGTDGGITRLETESMSGNVQVDGGLDASARVQLSTHSGDVTLRLPDGAHGRLAWASVNGTLSAGGPLTLLPGDVSGRGRGRQVQRYEFGRGDAATAMQIDITTFTGDAQLVRPPRR